MAKGKRKRKKRKRKKEKERKENGIKGKKIKHILGLIWVNLGRKDLNFKIK